jgi:DNA-binding NarL/FixJ family response regulator
VGILTIILFLLGVVFLFLGWRWQSPPNEEAMTALKGLAYLKREIIRVQHQVHILEDRVQTSQQTELKEATLREVEHREVELRDVERREIEGKQVNKLYSLKIKEDRDRLSGSGVEPKRNISPKYQEVLELAAAGHRIPEIAQHLLLSQDAVMMVLQTQSKGAAR